MQYFKDILNTENENHVNLSKPAETQQENRSKMKTLASCPQEKFIIFNT